MITLIGYSKSIIGFGLCGIKDIYEVTFNTSKEEILKLIKNSSGNFILIDEEVFNKIKSEIKFCKKKFIKIPDYKKQKNKEKSQEDDIDKIVKDTIGISINVE